MSEATTPKNTTFSVKCKILGEFWLSYKKDEEFQEFIEYNDLGLPLAYAISEGIVEFSSMAEQYINETWKLLLEGLEVEDLGFDSIDELLEIDE